MVAKYYEIPSMILQDIKETKRYGHTFGRSDCRSFGRTDNVKTVYPPTNTVCGGITRAANNRSNGIMYNQCTLVAPDLFINRILSINIVNCQLYLAVVSYCYSRVIVKHKVAKISRDWRLTEML